MGNNTQTIKQRFLDILFEDDEIEEPVRKPKAKPNDNKYKASDILYGKKEEPKKVEVVKKPVEQVKVETKPVNSNSAFINYDETKDVKNEEKEVRETNPVYDENYVAQPALSPIFGNIDKTAKKQEVHVDVTHTPIEKPGSSYLGTVLSPIYGYESNPNVPEVKHEETKEEVVEMVEENFDDVFPTNEYKNKDFDDMQSEEIDLFSYSKDK